MLSHVASMTTPRGKSNPPEASVRPFLSTPPGLPVEIGQGVEPRDPFILLINLTVTIMPRFCP